MSSIAIIYGTGEGQTEKIAEHINSVLTEAGHTVELVNSHAISPDFKLENYDGVMIGSSVHAGKHDKRIVAFTRAHLDRLQQIPSAFYSVSLAARLLDEKDQSDLDHLLDIFFKDSGWHPEHMDTFAGALLYSKYNRILRFVLKKMVGSRGGDTDTSRDYEYTDWDGVAEFAREFARQIPSVVT